MASRHASAGQSLTPNRCYQGPGAVCHRKIGPAEDEMPLRPATRQAAGFPDPLIRYPATGMAPDCARENRGSRTISATSGSPAPADLQREAGNATTSRPEDRQLRDKAVHPVDPRVSADN